MRIIKKILINLNIIVGDYFNNDINKLIKINRFFFTKPKTKPNVILFDFYRVLETEIIRSYLLKNLSSLYNAEINCFINSPFNNINFKWKSFYKSFGTAKFIYVKLNNNQKKESLNIFNSLIKKIKNKNDLFNLHVFNVHIGVDIYEEFMMKYQYPTFELSHQFAKKEIFNGIKLLVFWKDYFKRNKVKAIVNSHLSLRFLSLPAKIGGALYDIPFFSAHSNGLNFIKEPHNHSEFIKKVYQNYPKKFKKLNPSEKIKALGISKDRLCKRLSGTIGVDMDYSKKSAFVNSLVNKDFLISNKKNIKILICTHEFYDSPNSFGELLFNDFYEWLKFLIKFSEKVNYEWYVKLHPDFDTSTLIILNKLFKNKSNFHILESDISFHQIYKKNIKIALTCYGSVGHELPLIGFRVINAGTNPHIAYNFNDHPTSIKEYVDFLSNLEQAWENKIDLTKIYEFYYMHYIYSSNDCIQDFKFYDNFISEQSLDKSNIINYINSIDRNKFKKTLALIKKKIINAMK